MDGRVFVSPSVAAKLANLNPFKGGMSPVVKLDTSLLLAPSTSCLPCPNVRCGGRMAEIPSADCFACSVCGMLMSNAALSAMFKAQAQAVSFWAPSKGPQLTRQLLDQYLLQVMQQSKENFEEYERQARYAAYLTEFANRFYDAVADIAQLRGLVYGPQLNNHNSLGTAKGGALVIPPTNPIASEREVNFEASATPTSDEPIKAWRAWKVHPRRKGPKKDEPILRSITYETQWLPRVAFHARCILVWKKGQKRASLPKMTVVGPGGVEHNVEVEPLEHTAPVRDCTCGVYGKTTSRGAAHWAGQPRYGGMMGVSMGTAASQVLAKQIPIVGTVQMWGRVLLFSEGYRGEYAYPYHLFVPAHFNDMQTEQWGSADKLAAQLRSSYACDVEVVDFTPPEPPPGTERNPYANGGTA